MTMQQIATTQFLSKTEKQPAAINEPLKIKSVQGTQKARQDKTKDGIDENGRRPAALKWKKPIQPMIPLPS